jgi:sphingomyelin phosphodiesterase acid-like 3
MLSSSPRRAKCLLHLVVLLLLLSSRGYGWPGLHKAHPRSPGQSRHLLVVSDIHFDPFSDPALGPALAKAPVRKWESILSRSSSQAFSPYGQDTNWWLLASSLDGMREAEPNPALIIVTGDLLAHEFAEKYAHSVQDPDRNHYRAFVSRTVAFLALEVRKRYGKQQVFVTPGNNDDVCGDYTIQGNGPFLSDTAWTIGGLARARVQTRADWKAFGSYSLAPKGVRGLRIVSLNSIFFFNGYQPQSFADSCSAVQTDSPARTFGWLESVLSRAAANREQVWLLFHIPPGINGYETMMSARPLPSSQPTAQDACSPAIVPMWKPFWTDLFVKLAAQYPGTITAMFAGHDHNDDLRVLHAGQASQQFVLIDPPVSPIYGQNPSFRVVSFQAGGHLTDQTTWYLTNLPSASGRGSGIWKPEYTFSEQWQSPRLDAAALDAVYNHIRSDPEASQRWMTLLDVSSTYRPLPATAPRAMECAIANLDATAYRACYCPAP